MYLTAIIDWYSRKIVGWNLLDTFGTAYVLEAVKDAVATYGTPEILNSDQGCQFTSKEYKEMIRNYGIKQSMDGRSRWADNTIIERWFRSLKTEKIYPNEFASPRELRKGLIDYINEYNKVRPHEALSYRITSLLMELADTFSIRGWKIVISIVLMLYKSSNASKAPSAWHII